MNDVPTSPPVNPPYWQTAIDYLTERDEILGNLIALYPTERLTNHHNPFYTLARAVVGQQISVKAADSIWSRLEKHLETVSPESFSRLEVEILRGCGLSRQKVDYLAAIALAFTEGTLTPDEWGNMSDGEVRRQLIKIRGIGNWTAEMFLIFHLHRPDVLPLGDLGLINAIRRAYAGERPLSTEEIGQLAGRWRPYRTVATWYLWRSLDPVTVQY
ncbi:DNA-3-methyladenine glycosylase [Pannus brasiliensis CCIBt3594]|uniref:DNA-3-methyladenine glycosylase II n=1 Tax=Pannus brasiliensis CCIBt3594 TaxID=1427578 RepID=A0AAW9QYW5_9CHRO